MKHPRLREERPLLPNFRTANTQHAVRQSAWTNKAKALIRKLKALGL